MTTRIRLSVLMTMTVAAASLSAHVIVSPTLSKSGAVQKYEVRVHNEAKVAATSIEVDIPDGVTIVDIAKSPNGTATTKKAGDRVTGITWKIDVQPNKYVALPFTAKNPVDGVAELHWTLHEHLADGSTVDWSDKAGSKEKGSVTKLASAVQPPSSAATDQRTFTGTITDDMCANADHSQMQMGPTAEACAKACVEEHGAAYVLFDGTNAYTLSDQRLPERFAGTKVRVTGTLDAKTKTIRVNSIRSGQ